MHFRRSAKMHKKYYLKRIQAYYNYTPFTRCIIIDIFCTKIERHKIPIDGFSTIRYLLILNFFVRFL